MHLLQILLFKRRVIRWLAALVSLWVAIIVGLAFSKAGAVGAEGSPVPPSNKSHAATVTVQTSSVSSVRTGPRSPVRSIRSFSSQSMLDFAIERYRAAPPFERSMNLNLAAFDAVPKRAAAAPRESQLHMDGLCQTPMSLMLHSSFGAVRMHKLAKEILVQDLKTTTYREVTEVLRRGECPSSNSIIVSIDDFGTDWLRPHFQSMIHPFTERGLRLVVGVNVHGSQDPDAWSYLRELETLGNEVASHTIDHYNLARLEPHQISWQIKGAHQIICHNLGRCPETLILPFGIIDENGYVHGAASGYSYIVGIPGGRVFGGDSPYYLGRIAPDNFDQRATLYDLSATFGGPDTMLESVLELRASRCAFGPSPSLTFPLAQCLPSAAQAPPTAHQDSFTADVGPLN